MECKNCNAGLNQGEEVKKGGQFFIQCSYCGTLNPLGENPGANQVTIGSISNVTPGATINIVGGDLQYSPQISTGINIQAGLAILPRQEAEAPLTAKETVLPVSRPSSAKQSATPFVQHEVPQPSSGTARPRPQTVNTALFLLFNYAVICFLIDFGLGTLNFISALIILAVTLGLVYLISKGIAWARTLLLIFFVLGVFIHQTLAAGMAVPGRGDGG